MSSDRVALGHLEAVYPMLDLLQVGFLVLDARGQVRHISAFAGRMLGRRIDGDGVRRILGEHYDELVIRIQTGRAEATRWREVDAATLQGDRIDLAIRSTGIDDAQGGIGVLLAFSDISVEVGLHRRYRELLNRQEAINEELRRRIAEVLREHEDDHAQFSELLQIAPAIFHSFVTEAETAVRAVSRVAEAGDLDESTMVVALRESHTLKGNARGLGLNFIAGRAHAVEDLLAAARSRHRLPDRTELLAGIADLRRAIQRAVSLRGDLESEATPDDGAARRGALGDVSTALAAAMSELHADHPARQRLEEAAAALDRMSCISLAQLRNYLRASARTAAAAAGCDEPSIDLLIEDVAVAPRVHAALQTALPHLVRNAVVHGLETAAERVAAGKASAGVITVEARLEGDELVVRVRDDGRGIDRATLEAKLTAVGGDPAGASLADLVFHPGLSSRTDADLDAGRGMGALAARDAILGLGGRLQVETTPGQGTVFTATVPLRRATDRAR